MKCPYFSFYPGDWQRNSNIKRCSLIERGAWVEILCLFHDSDEYGVLRWTKKNLAKSIPASIKIIDSLIEKKILKGCESGLCEPYIYVPRHARQAGDPVELIARQEGPIWYSSRMVKDEYIRSVRAQNGSPKVSPKVSPHLHPPANSKQQTACFAVKDNLSKLGIGGRS